METEETTQKTSWLKKDLKKIILISLILIIVLVGLSIVNARTNFLANLAELIMGKLIGQ